MSKHDQYYVLCKKEVSGSYYLFGYCYGEPTRKEIRRWERQVNEDIIIRPLSDFFGANYGKSWTAEGLKEIKGRCPRIERYKK